MLFHSLFYSLPDEATHRLPSFTPALVLVETPMIVTTLSLPFPLTSMGAEATVISGSKSPTPTTEKSLMAKLATSALDAVHTV